MKKDAVISPCERYRYSLVRDWRLDLFEGEGKGRVLFVMLNPSTADADRDDATNRRCVGYARSWGYTSLEVVNLFAFRATKPKDLWEQYAYNVDIVGPDADRYIAEAKARCGLVVGGWGTPAEKRPVASERARALRELLGPVHHLGLTKFGQPKHPLYLKGDAALALLPSLEEPCKTN